MMDFNVNGKTFTYIDSFNVVGYENEQENIDILVKGVKNEREARNAAEKALELFDKAEYYSDYRQFHLSYDELIEFYKKVA